MDEKWPPRLIFNTDGHWIINYQDRWDPEDITRMMPELADAGVDALSVLVGIDDDLSWRGSPHGQLWGDNIQEWNPDPLPADIHGNPLQETEPVHIHGRPIRKIEGRPPMAAHEFLHWLFARVIEDGHDLMRIYVEAAGRHGMAAYASFRMNDAHACSEDRGWYGRSQQKMERPDLLLGSPVPGGVHGAEWSFSWRWNYAREEVRNRFLGLFDETLRRYDFDGLELDFSRAPPFFRAGEVVENIPTMTRFVRDTREITRRHSASKGREIRLIVRVPVGMGKNLEAGMDAATWIREDLADIVVLGSTGYCVHEIDIARAVRCAENSGVLIFTGFDGATYTASPQEGYERNPSGVLRATALNGYREGAAGVHLFNYDYPSHRAGPAGSDDFNVFDDYHLQTLRDLREPRSLERRNRCYYLPAPPHGGGPDHRIQLPRKLALMGRGAGPGHALRLTIHDDIEGGKSSGRIAKTELRLRLENLENSQNRIHFEVNGKVLPFEPDGTVTNRQNQQWIVFDDPPLRQGFNSILLILQGIETPTPWPSVQQCEFLVFAGERKNP
jgi:hypothetical protein